jgi:hypothetical protein
VPFIGTDAPNAMVLPHEENGGADRVLRGGGLVDFSACFKPSGRPRGNARERVKVPGQIRRWSVLILC